MYGDENVKETQRTTATKETTRTSSRCRPSTFRLYNKDDCTERTQETKEGQVILKCNLLDDRFAPLSPLEAGFKSFTPTTPRGWHS